MSEQALKNLAKFMESILRKRGYNVVVTMKKKEKSNDNMGNR